MITTNRSIEKRLRIARIGTKENEKCRNQHNNACGGETIHPDVRVTVRPRRLTCSPQKFTSRANVKMQLCVTQLNLALPQPVQFSEIRKIAVASCIWFTSRVRHILLHCMCVIRLNEILGYSILAHVTTTGMHIGSWSYGRTLYLKTYDMVIQSLFRSSYSVTVGPQTKLPRFSSESGTRRFKNNFSIHLVFWFFSKTLSITLLAS